MIVVLPVCVKDLDAALRNLQWCIELDGKAPFACLISVEIGFDCSRVEQLAREYFSSVTVFRYQQYPRFKSSQWPRPQNWAWRNVALHIGKSIREPWLWWEQDSVPLKPMWLSAIALEYEKQGKPFMGAQGATAHPQSDPHLNGVAVYPHDWQRTASQAMIFSDSIPFDVAGGWRVMQNAAITSLIKHVWSQEGPQGPPTTFKQKIDKWILTREAVLFHRCKDDSLINLLRQVDASMPLPEHEPRRRMRRKPDWLKKKSSNRSGRSSEELFD